MAESDAIRAMIGGVRGEVLWQPDDRVLAASRLGAFMAWLGERGLELSHYGALLEWSVTDLDAFWSTVQQYFDLGRVVSGPALASAAMPGAVWFPNSTWNYASEALRHDIAGPAIIARSQTRPPIELSMFELRDQVARCRAGLVRLGVRRGDRVAAYAPNVPESVIALLATASLGAIWTSCPPEFGVRSVVDRMAQVQPTVLLAVDGYRYGAKAIDRHGDVAAIRAALPSLRHTVSIPYLDPSARLEDTVTWDELVAEAAPLEFEQVPFDHPLYILYSSGTTGLPKAIVHSHGGIVCEHVKALALQSDLGPGDRFFWFSTTGWMMWNFLVSGLAVGAAIVLFDGDPSAPDLTALWRLAADAGVTFFGTSAPFIVACRQAGLRPGDELDLHALRAVGSTGAPLPAEGFRWIYDAVSRDVLLSSISGGTDVCTAFVGGCPLLPVRAGEIAAPYLGIHIQALDATGTPVVGEEGELVITSPMPSMPVGFWNDYDGARYRSAYFEDHPGVWTHGDWITIREDGSCSISGRADATLNRGGVRLGTAEIYAVVDDLAEIADSIVVFLEDDAGGPGELQLFVVLGEGVVLGEDLRVRVAQALRSSLSPRHVPDRIVQIPAVPRTLSGKRLEVPVKRILQGAAVERSVSLGSLADPSALDVFVAMAAGRAT